MIETIYFIYSLFLFWQNVSPCFRYMPFWVTFMCISLMILTGLSLKTQELTAIFLIIRILCHFMLIRDIYIVLDSLTLLSTLWVIYMIRFKLKTTYLQELDNMPLYYVVSTFVCYLKLDFYYSLFSILSIYDQHQHAVHITTIHLSPINNNTILM